LAVVLAAALRAALRRRPPLAGAIELDRHHRLDVRVANALAFSAVDPKERTPLMELALADAADNAQKLDPRRAVPLRLPRETWLVALLAAGVTVIALFEVRTLRILPPPPAPPPVLMSADDIELFRDVGEELKKATRDPAQKIAVARYNQLVEDIAQHRVDRHEVFRRLAEIERDLGRDLEADQQALDEGLEGIARELAGSPLARKAAEALADKRLADAEKALRELAEKLKAQKNKPNAAELERLRKALERAGKESQGRLSAIEQRRRELQAERESLLKKKREQADAGPATDQKLQENQRKLEHLDRQKQQAERSASQMSELDRELAKAAEDLKKELGDAAKDLEKGAENVNRMARQKLDEEQKRELLRRLKELREVLRQESQGGDGRKARLERFGDKARGNRPGDGQGQQGKGQGQGKGKPELRLGRGGTEIELPGQGQPASGAQAKGGGDQPSDGNQLGQGAGNSHDPNLVGKQTKLPGAGTQDVSAAGIDSGEGTASAEVIYGAAERGFRGRGYQDIFTEYETVAEQVLEKDEIPSGYRFYVRRYFQLIRPRE
jgi:methyl-accepting chemotaxis protein